MWYRSLNRTFRLDDKVSTAVWQFENIPSKIKSGQLTKEQADKRAKSIAESANKSVEELKRLAGVDW